MSRKYRKWAQPKRTRKGVPNLKRGADGLLTNQYGVTFTNAERKRLESLVNSVNRKRKRQMEKARVTPWTVAGRDTGMTMEDKMKLGDEPEFILAPRVKGLQRFKSKDQFSDYLDNLQKAMSPEYELQRMRLYKSNYLKALRENVGSWEDHKDVYMKIQMMKPQEFIKLVNQDEALEISFAYDPSDIQGRLNQMRGALGMRMKEDEIEDWDEDDPW